MTASRIRADEGLQAALHQLNAYASSLGRSDTEDLVQEALARAIANGVPVEAIPWMRTVMRRIAIDRARRAREVASGDSFDMDGLAAEPGDGPEDLVVSGERARAVREALAALPPRYREALLAYATDGRASAVAEQMSLSSQATWTLLSRARDRLRTQLERIGFVPAAFAARFAPWWQSATTGAVAATCLIVVIAGGGAPVAPRGKTHAPHDVALAAAAPLVRTGHSTPASAAHVAAPRADAARLKTPIQPERPAQLGAKGCPAGEDNWVGVTAYVYDDEQDTVTVNLLRQVPEQARVLEVQGCES